MKLCLSQFRSGADIEDNLRRHRETLRASDADLVVFPELSTTGYRLRPPKVDVSSLHDVGTLGFVGVPLGRRIGMAVVGTSLTYAKQLLHPDELPFFEPGSQDVDVDVAGHRIAPAICFESLDPGHADRAAGRGATIYVAMVAKPEDAMVSAHVHYQRVAEAHGIWVVAVNAVGPCDGFEAGGRSAVWGPDGVCILALNEMEGTASLVI